MRRNLVSSLFEHERVSTTLEKAKEVRSFAEKLITLAKKGDLAARRRAISMLGNRDVMSSEEEGEARKGTVIGKLFSEIGPRYLDRPGGYTRIVKLAMNRLGDNGQIVLLQLVGKDEGEKESQKNTTNKRARRAEAFAKSVEARQGTAKAPKKKKAAEDEKAAEQPEQEGGEQATES
jgi:large subunit ribosomal protein L17